MTSELVQNPNVMIGRVAETAVLFNLEDRQLHSLNETAATCWDLLSVAPTEQLLISAISRTYGLEEVSIAGEVRAVVGDFRAAGLCGAAAGFVDLTATVKRETITVSRQPKSSTIGPLSALGIPIILDVEDHDLRSDLTKILAPLVLAKGLRPFESEAAHKSCDAALIDISVRCDGDRWSVSTNGEPALTFATRRATIRHVIATINSKPLEYLDDVVVFHAAAAEFDSGVAMFPGVSNAGKSTLITQLIHRGYKYVSDEAVAVSAVNHHVVPFPKSISIDVGSQELLGPLTGVPQLDWTIDVDPRTIGPGQISAGGTVNRIIFPEYRSSSPTLLEPLDAFDTFNRLLANSFRFETAGQSAFDAVVSLANNVPAFALTHSGDVAHLELIEALVPKRSPILGLGSTVRK